MNISKVNWQGREVIKNIAVFHGEVTTVWYGIVLFLDESDPDADKEQEWEVVESFASASDAEQWINK